MKDNRTDSVQNQFTAYIAVALQRRRNAYIIEAMQLKQVEVLTENPVSDGEYDILDDIIKELPLMLQLENEKLLMALKALGKRERQVILARVLEEKSFEELAKMTGLGYKGVTAVYYRALQKVQKYMKEAGSEF